MVCPKPTLRPTGPVRKGEVDMAIRRCPGQDTRCWKADDVHEETCPHCGAAIEFWKDEVRRRCRNCGKMVANPKVDLACAVWCKHAAECLGLAARPDAEGPLCDALIDDMKATFAGDERRICHALAVLECAEKILEGEAGDPLVVKAAAILHDIGIKEAERKHGSSEPRFHEMEGPPIAREILRKHGVDDARADAVCAIVANHHSAKDMDMSEFRIVHDADRLINIVDVGRAHGADTVRDLAGVGFHTEGARRLAAESLSSLRGWGTQAPGDSESRL